MTRRLIVALLAALPVPMFLHAQSGSVEGTVTTSGAPLADVVVYLVPSQARDSEPLSPEPVDVDQRELRFVPRVVAITPGSTVSFTNSDSVMHNVFHPPHVFSGGFDLGTYPPGERRSFTFSREGAFLILCHIHPEMVGYVVVVASRHRAVTDAEGHFRIEAVPAGRYTLRTWHARSSSQSEVVFVHVGDTVHLNLSLERGRPDAPAATRPPEQSRGTPPRAPQGAPRH